MSKLNESLHQFVKFLSTAAGFWWSMGAVVIWAALIPFFIFDTWLLIFTVYLSIAAIVVNGMILVAGQRISDATQAKLDEIIRSIEEARNEFIGLDERTEEEIAQKRHEEQNALDREPRIPQA